MAEVYNSSTGGQKSPLEQISQQYLNKELGLNRYSSENGYGVNNKDAISDGDEFGKGQSQDGSVGSKTDILTRNETVAKNRYNSDNGYSSTSKDALSDGDEFGKGENNGSVGSLTDIKTRIEVVAKNKFGESKRYPDF